MPDIESAAKFTLKVSVGDPTKPVDLNTILEQIGNVKVYENLPEIPINTEPTLLFVVPEGDFDASKIFTAIERRTEEWFESRSDAVTVEVHKPDGHLQVLAKKKG